MQQCCQNLLWKRKITGLLEIWNETKAEMLNKPGSIHWIGHQPELLAPFLSPLLLPGLPSISSFLSYFINFTKLRRHFQVADMFRKWTCVQDCIRRPVLALFLCILFTLLISSLKMITKWHVPWGHAKADEGNKARSPRTPRNNWQKKFQNQLLHWGKLGIFPF